VNLNATSSLPEGSQKALSLRLNFSWALAGNIIYAACQWGMLSVLAKLGSPEMVGLFALGIAVTQPVAAFTNLQLRGIFCSDASNQYFFGDYLSVRIIGVVVAFVAVVCIAFYSYDEWVTIMSISAMSLAIGAQSIADIYYAFYQKYERLDFVSKSMVLKGFISLFAVIVAAIIFDNVFWIIFALAFSRITIVFFFDIPLSRTLGCSGQRKLRFSFDKIKTILWIGLPMGVNMMVLSWSINIPRYYVEAHCGEYALGIFSALAYVMVAGNMLTNALSQSVLPRLAKLSADNNIKSFRKIIFKLIFIAFMMTCIALIMAYFWGKPLLSFLYTPEYAKFHTLFMLVVFAGCLGIFGSFFGVGLTAARIFKAQPLLNGIACIVSFVCAFILIPEFGLIGAGIASVVAASTATILFAGRLFAFVTFRNCNNL
jgi:O-antigen/teichoic acid export membrane protein